MNHCDLVRTSHLAGGEPGSVAKPRTATGALPQRLQEDAVTRCDRYSRIAAIPRPLPERNCYAQRGCDDRIRAA